MEKVNKAMRLGIKTTDMDFGEFIDKNFNASEYCHLLALDAHTVILSEMAMLGGEVPKMHILYDEDDWKFLSQFPPVVWKEALTWRYNRGLRDMLRNAQLGEIPEGFDYTNKLIFKKPRGREGQYWVFGSDDGPKNGIWIGLTELAHKLTDRPKVNPEDDYGPESEKPTRYWGHKGPGSSLKEIDPKETDETKPTHPKNYKHGLYNFDLSGMAEVHPEDINNMSDWEIYPLLPQKEFGHLDFDLEAVRNSPRVKEAVAEIKRRMKKEPKHTFVGYDVLQPDKAGESISNWIKANATEERLFGDHKDKINDPFTNEEKSVQSKNPHQVKSDMHPDWDMRTANGAMDFNIPTIKRTINITEVDEVKKTKQLLKKTEWDIPVLSAVKTIPTLGRLPSELKLTDHQKAAFAATSGYNWNPNEMSFEQAVDYYRNKGGGDEESKKKKGANFKLAASPEDTQKVLNHWHVLTDVQKKWLKDHTHSLHTQAQTYHTQGAHGDPHANPKNKSFYGVGFSPNYKTNERWSFNMPQEKVDAFVDTYLPKMVAEVMGTAVKGKAGEWQKSKLDWYMRALKEKGVPQSTIDALENRIPQIAEFIGYTLLTWLDSPRYGIKDDNFDLLIHTSPAEHEEEEEDNKRRRQGLIHNYLTSLAQKATSDGILSRRRRERYGVMSVASADQPAGESGASGAGNIEAGQTAGKSGKAENIDTSAVRRWLNSDLTSSMMLSAAHKPHEAFSHVQEFLASKRAYVINVLRSGKVAAQMGKDEDLITTAMNTSIELWNHFDEQLKGKIPDEAKREEEVKKLVAANLPKTLQQNYPKLYSGIEGAEWEKVLSPLKNLNIKNLAIAADSPMKVKEVMDKFLDTLTKGQAAFPVYDDNEKKFKYDTIVINLADNKKFNPNDPAKVIEFIYDIYPKQYRTQAVLEKGGDLYDAIHESQGLAHIDPEVIAKKWDVAVQAWQKGQQVVTPQEPHKFPATPSQPMAAVATSLGALLDGASKFNTPAEMLQTGNAILAKENELLTDKAAAAKLQAAIEAMKQRRKHLVQFPATPPEYTFWMKLHSLLTKIQTTHG